MSRGRIISLALAASFAIASGCVPTSFDRSSDQLLRQLRTELDEIRSKPTAVGAPISEPDVSHLVGAPRSLIVSRLGPPDFCDDGEAARCDNSTHWYYFFFNHPVRDEAGNVVVTAGGGTALEIHFGSSRAVEAARWQAQR